MSTTTEAPTSVATTAKGGRAYWFLDTLAIDRTPRQGATPTVLEVTIPAGGSPPLHLHREVDDSFYVLDGRLAVRCGDDTFVATAGDYLALPKGVPHTFRVVDGRSARILQVHEDDSFLRFVQAVSEPAETRQLPLSVPSVDFESLARASAEIARAPMLGPSMTEEEAQTIVARHRLPPTDLRARLGGVVHLMLTVRDLGISDAWYRDLLGLVRISDHRREDGSGELAMLHPSTGLVVALRSRDRDDGGFDETRIGLDHLAFGVRDRAELEAWELALRERGIPHGGIIDVPFGSGITVRDPDGIQVELFAPPSRPLT